MRIFLYSDLHISRTSSIMPMLDNSKYTYRQEMIKKTGEYLADIIDQQKPDVIINLGDTFDQHTITSYDIDTASEFFSCFRMFNIPHLVLVGNHEMINQDFNAIKLLKNITNISVIDKPCTLNDWILQNGQSENIQLAFLPYCDHKDILEFPEGTYLFSHQDIQGSSIRGDFNLPDGIEPNILKDKYKLVFNGHIHKPSIMGNVVNVGSITTHSFSDDETTVPQCYIFDTNTMDLQTFKSNLCPLFRKIEIKDNVSELQNYIMNLDNSYKYILHIICPFVIKEEVKQFISTQEDKIIASRINVKVLKDNKEEVTEDGVVNMNLQSNLDIKKTFTDFLKTVELKYPMSLYNFILKDI